MFLAEEEEEGPTQNEETRQMETPEEESVQWDEDETADNSGQEHNGELSQFPRA